ncbi:hypothetical protein QF042_002869 [Pedobacter sp. W3I1]|uniref:hypothetical protein n=1 Tax=Pedobacter sp. W3I1 TaxID=3042291 RepID=UPI002784D555|nr:hypothetical protein [Pedobacter sp. W3I1]MDQ0639304.1 hypothetical protein [Pedobacter sp. W3I1]
MNIKLKELSESEFHSLNIPILFEDKLEDRNFGLISGKIYSYKFGWQSTAIKPVVTEIDEFRCSIGVDLNFVV